LRIGINALFLQKPATGLGQHLINLLRALDKCDRRNEYVLLSPRFRRAYAVTRPQFSDRFHEVEVVTMLARLGENFEKLWWEQIGIVSASRKEQVDLLHSPYFASPLLSPVPTVVTIHDVIPLILPEYGRRQSSQLYNWLVATAARRARAIIAVSECSKRDIERTLGIPGHRIHVIGNAVDTEQYYPVTDSWKLKAVRERYSIPQRYLLYFGGFDTRKNVLRLIRAYASILPRMEEKIPLVIAGRLHLLGHPLYPDPRPLVRELGLENHVLFTGQIREEDKAPLYSGAELFLFPSLYEGFGMPVLEAMACGTAVITSNGSALPEVVGDAGVLIDPTSEEAIGQAILELLADHDRRADLAARARLRARGFNWSQVAEQTVRVYEEVMGARGLVQARA